MKHFILALLICSAQLVPVKFQEVTESSGESLASVSPAQTIDSLESSGEGPAVITVLDDVELIGDTLTNDTDFSNVNFKDGDLSNETTLSTTSTTTSTMTTTVTSTTTEAATLPSTTTTETTTTVATTTTTPTTTTVSTTTTTTPPPTTTPTTTTTRLTTTRRPTTMSTTTKRTTKIPLFTTTISPEKIIPKSDVPCEFIEKDLECDIELSCFGEGTIDCTTMDEEFPAVEDSKQSSAATTDIPDDYEEESATVGFYPPELVGRIPPRFAFPWNIKSLDETSSEPSIESTLDVGTSTESPTSMIQSTTDRSETSSSTTTPESSSNLVTNTMASSTILSTTFISSTPPRENVTEILGESSTFTINNITAEEPLTVKPLEENTSVLITRLEAMTGPTETSLESSDGITEQEMTAVLRRKRDSNKKESSQSLKLAAEETKRQTGSCKISGNLYCTPTPTRAFCKGIGTCKVISMEKTEKSTSSKGVENWAIAVIAICATAAALTIGLLVYLVVTSWKKLKVQPQNGVTTLNYVNNSPP